MPQLEIDNRTQALFEPLFLFDENGGGILSTFCKLTMRIIDSALVTAESQIPPFPAGEFVDDTVVSSYRYEPEVAPLKLATDVILVGHAHAKDRSGAVDAGLKVGPVQKVVRVFGDRYWIKTGGSIRATRPQPFDRVPLIYERAFGGWDKASKDERDWSCDPRNPVGRGFGDPLRYVEEGRVPMPNIEDPQHLIRQYGDTPAPQGFGFVSPHWQPRAQYGGTYDEAWENQRKPLLPLDFDRRFFNAASPGMIAPGYLKGDEEVVAVNLSTTSQLRFNLPGIPPPLCTIDMRYGKKADLRTNLDTVIINTDEMLVILIWRAFTPVPNGPHDVVAIRVEQDQAASGGRMLSR